MAEPKSFDDVAFEIPEDADPGTKLHLRAQMTLQAAIYACGEKARELGDYSLGTREIPQILATALAMVLAQDTGLRSRSAIR